MQTLRIVVKKPYEKPYETVIPNSEYNRKVVIAGVESPNNPDVVMFMLGDPFVLGTINQNHHVDASPATLNFYNPMTGNPIYGTAFFSRFDPGTHPYVSLEDSDVGYLLNAFTDGVGSWCRMLKRKGNL